MCGGGGLVYGSGKYERKILAVQKYHFQYKLLLRQHVILAEAVFVANNTCRIGPELPGAKAAATTSAVNKFRLWRVLIFKNPIFLAYSHTKAATGATRVAVFNFRDTNLAFPAAPSPFLRF
jgi:hypothetical protein